MPRTFVSGLLLFRKINCFTASSDKAEHLCVLEAKKITFSHEIYLASRTCLSFQESNRLSRQALLEATCCFQELHGRCGSRVTGDPSEREGCVLPDVLGQSCSHGHVTRGGTGADEGHRRASLRARLHSLGQVCIPDSRPTQLVDCRQGSLWLSILSPPPHHLSHTVSSLAWETNPPAFALSPSAALTWLLWGLPPFPAAPHPRSYPLPPVSLALTVLLSPPLAYKHAQVLKEGRSNFLSSLVSSLFSDVLTERGSVTFCAVSFPCVYSSTFRHQ